MIALWILLFVLAAVVAAPFVLEALRSEPNEAEALGEFVDLPSGRTHFRWIGPVRGPVAVCIHGLSTPSPVWEDFAEVLAETGYRVLVYDIFGRGYSAAVPGRQDEKLLCGQLSELLHDQGLDQDLTIIGYSMGGSIATAFAAAQIERMKRLILLAPSGIEMRDRDGYREWRLKPLIGGWIHRVIEPWRMAAYVPRDPYLAKLVRKDVKRRGYFPSILSSRRGMLAVNQELEHRLLGREGVPVVAIWGLKDPVIPASAKDTLAEWNPQASQIAFEDADHGLPYTHGFEIGAEIRELLRF